MVCELSSLFPFIVGLTLNANHYLQMPQILLPLLNEQKIHYILQKIPPYHFINGKVGRIQDCD